MKIKSIPQLTLITLLACAASAPVAQATVAADSKILFIGSAVADYEATFMGIYNADATVNTLNLTTDTFDPSYYGLLEDFHEGLDTNTPKNALMLKLDEGFDYVVFLPEDFIAEESPELTMEAARLLKSYTRELGTEVITVLPWDRTDAVNTAPFVEHIYRLSDALGLDCVPAGLSWSAVLQDPSIPASECRVSIPNETAEYTLATTLYAHLFEQTPAASTYSHGSLSAADQTAIMNHSYSVWDSARTATHYTGDYIGTFCPPFAMPHDLGNRKWASMGTSTEDRTRIRLKEIIERAGYAYQGVHMNGYSYSTGRYFSDNLGDSSAQATVANNDFDFAFGRYEEYNYTQAMDLLHQYDPDTGGDTQFLFFPKHYPNEPYLTYDAIGSSSQWSTISAASDPDAHAIPNFIGFGRVLRERPELDLIPTYDAHLTLLGSYLQAGMIYTMVTGGQNPALVTSTWTADEQYVLNVAYKTVMELGGLKHVPTPPIAYSSQSETIQNTPVSITLEGIDLDALPLSATIVSQPENGTLSGSGLSYTYTPDNGFYGEDSFSFRMSNGEMDSEISIASITVAYGAVDIIGNVTGGEFADYTALSNGADWGDSSDDDGVVTLTVSQKSLDDSTTSANTFDDRSDVAGASLTLRLEPAGIMTAADAITNNAFVSFQLASSGGDITLDSIRASVYKHTWFGPSTYQWAVDADGDGFDVDDLIGSAVTIPSSEHRFDEGDDPLVLSATLATAPASSQEIRLYAWAPGRDTTTNAAWRIVEVRGEYTVASADTTPPAAPQGLTVDSAAASVVLSWTANTEGDLGPGGVYTVYRSDSSGSGYSMIASNLTLNGYTDESVTIGQTYYYQVTATDLSGNESDPSAELAVTVEELPTEIDIIGSFKTAGGEFADYSGLASNGLWGDSSDADGTITLTASRIGVDTEVSASRWNPNAYSGAGSEINFTKQAGTIADLAGAITAKTFISFQLDTGTDLSTFDSLSLSLWRNGPAAAENYQWVYDADGDGFEAADALGSVVNVGDTASFNVSASGFSSSEATLHEVRLYFWGTSTNGSGNTHLYEVRAEYTVAVAGTNTYVTWADQFGENQQIGLPVDDYDQDGVPNLVEYALGQDPTVRSEIMDGQLEMVNGSSEWVVAFDRHADRTDVNLYLMHSTTLAPDSWDIVVQSIGGGSVEVLGGASILSESGADPQTVRLLMPSNPKSFFSWRVEQP